MILCSKSIETGSSFKKLGLLVCYSNKGKDLTLTECGYVVCVCACMCVLCGMAESAICHSSCLILTLSLSWSSRSVREVAGYTLQPVAGCTYNPVEGHSAKTAATLAHFEVGGKPRSQKQKACKTFVHTGRTRGEHVATDPEARAVPQLGGLGEKPSSVWSVVFPLAPPANLFKL